MINAIEHVAIASLALLSSVFHVHALPESANSGWTVTEKWHDEGGTFVMVAKSEALVQQCQTARSSFIQFPPVFLATHSISVDGKPIENFGDESTQGLRSFYGAPIVSCKNIGNGSALEWRVAGNVGYFAHFNTFPKLVPARPSINFAMETVNIMAAAILFVMAIFSLIVFFGKVSMPMNISFGLAQIFLGGYFVCTVPEFFAWNSPAPLLHRISDLCLWTGACFLFNAYRLSGLFGKKSLYSLVGVSVLAACFILFGSKPDVVQFGTNLPFAVALLGMILAMRKLIKNAGTLGWQKGSLFQFLSLGFFTASAFNDIFVIVGLRNGLMVFGAGIVGTIVFFAFSVNEQIMVAYNERDHLRANLQQEVTKKTEELSSKTNLLETTMVELRSTQAELIQSAKLASLGTLSAGIAHEINNSLNYVNGALKPLEKIVLANVALSDNKKVSVLLQGMREGLSLTFDIIKSLRSYTGLNQSKFNDISLKNLIDSVLVMVKNKLIDNVRVELDVHPDLIIFGHIVGLNQVFMNLIVNSIDAMPRGGVLSIKAEALDANIRVTIADTGNGISGEVIERIFEPFFTTKEVGKGTGLGLYLVRKEIERHQGSITVSSKTNEGTIFTLVIPKDHAPENKVAA